MKLKKKKVLAFCADSSSMEQASLEASPCQPADFSTKLNVLLFAHFGFRGTFAFLNLSISSFHYPLLSWWTVLDPQHVEVILKCCQQDLMLALGLGDRCGSGPAPL